MDDKNHNTFSETIESIRTRPSMYIGGTDFFGFIHYVVAAYDVMFQNNSTWVELEIKSKEDGKPVLYLSSDAKVDVNNDEKGHLINFEVIKEDNDNNDSRFFFDGTIVTALSSVFHLIISDGITQTELITEFGERKLLQQKPADNQPAGIKMIFSPDPEIFRIADISPAVVHSYSRRIACLRPDVLFRIKLGEEITEYKSEKGIRDLFDAITMPYQILHKPIHIKGNDDNLNLEVVFTFHSWTENRIWSYANKGRVPDGGTHEDGFMEAVTLFNKDKSDSRVGVLAVLALEYPHVMYKGCIKERIGNPELKERVFKLVKSGTKQWLSENKNEAEFIKSIERFIVPVIW